MTTTPDAPARRGWRKVAALKGGTASDLWLYLRYQTLSKLLLALVVMPLFSLLATLLIASTGRASITSGDFTGFALSPQGAALAITATLLVGLVVVLDIAAFVIAELARLRGTPIRTGRQLLLRAVGSVPRFLHPSMLLFLAHVVVVVPLAGLGPTLSVLSWVRIPNFVTEVIVNSTTLSILYVIVLLVLAVLSFFLIVTVQAMFTDDLNPWQAMGASMKFVRRHWWAITVTLVRGPLVLGSIVLGFMVVVFVALALLALLLPESVTATRFSAVLATLLLAGAIGFFLLFLVPIELRNLTRAYAVLTDAVPVGPREEVRVADRRARPRLVAAAAAALAAAMGASALGAHFFEELFINEHRIVVIAHRGGGDLDAENSLEGVEAAIGAGATWSEIDIQRTRDGAYVVNHDATFARLSGVSRTSSEMTLAEIQELSITNAFSPGRPARRVPTIEQMMDVAKDRIGLFVELKGATADERMVDDMVDLIKERGVQDQVALIGLDHALMSYVETTYPEILTGYLYYFGVGDTASLDFDYLIIEEGVASSSRVHELQEAGRKVVVWTVNTEDSINRFAGSRVDGIITDVPVEVAEGVAAKRERDDLELILDSILGE
ncbi:MAG: glycerophosphoryl diester phosphodiesterase membrane domain-containing protein [Arachnia propionica]|uniref:glycerophosphodiester phosphodiesterase family protein n=1 Tax=Arachnia propionica TaxID=1750 RepID=UPI002710F33A|nr:glycerophosphoryl diester phosphodiesterase membrane domain-containing protein [Arachnia propionica]